MKTKTTREEEAIAKSMHPRDQGSQQGKCWLFQVLLSVNHQEKEPSTEATQSEHGRLAETKKNKEMNKENREEEKS